MCTCGCNPKAGSISLCEGVAHSSSLSQSVLCDVLIKVCIMLTVNVTFLPPIIATDKRRIAFSDKILQCTDQDMLTINFL